MANAHQIIKINQNQMKALTWMNDVDGLVCLDLGETVKVVYEADPTCRFVDAVGEYSKLDFLACVMNTTEQLN